MLMMHEGCKMNEKMKLNPKTKQSATKHKVNMTCQDEETRYRPMHDKGSKGVCKKRLCGMHEKCTCGEKCVKYTMNEPNMFLMRKHEKPQSLVLIEVQTSETMGLRDILSNIQHAHYEQQCETMHEHHEIHP